MKDLLEMHKLHDGCPVMVAKIPKQIQKEIDVWVRECKKIKNHPLAELRAHHNYGYLYNPGSIAYNAYQVSIPKNLVDNSFWMAWVIRLSHKYWGAIKKGDELLGDRLFRLRQYHGHYDGYDLWTNFAYKGNSNPVHSHAGFLSGVIYYKNHGHPTIFPEYNCGYEGLDGTMVMFPNTVEHTVKEQTVNKERITIAFNILGDVR
jgi:hypothetical protein